VRPFLPAILAGALARGNAGIDFSGTDYSFLESVPFLVALAALAVLSFLWESRKQKAESAARAIELGSAVIGLVLGALLFAGALADHHHKDAWIGVFGGIACSALGYLALAALFGRARRRLEGQGGALALLDAYAEVIALALAGIAIAVPVVSYAALVVFVFLIARSRSERAQKFEGLRILR
jgi:uncharacterized membrane protein